MSDARTQFLDAYDAHRVRDQIEFYEKRVDEYTSTARQIGRANTFFLALAAVCGVIGSFYPDQNRWLGLVAAGLSALAAAVASWGDVVGFSANSELYQAALGGLNRLRPRRPRTEDAGSTDVIEKYMTDVEEILMGEVTSWSEKWGGSESSGEDVADHGSDED